MRIVFTRNEKKISSKCKWLSLVERPCNHLRVYFQMKNNEMCSIRLAAMTNDPRSQWKWRKKKKKNEEHLTDEALSNQYLHSPLYSHNAQQSYSLYPSQYTYWTRERISVHIRFSNWFIVWIELCQFIFDDSQKCRWRHLSSIFF